MSEQNIPILPYAKADNLIDIRGYVSIEGVEEKIEIPDKKHLILYNRLLANGEIFVPRNHDSFRIFLKPTIAKGHSQNDFSHLLLNGESIEKILKLKLQVWCKNTRWCSNQLTVNLSEANGRKEVYFDIPLSEVKEEIVISGFVIRETGSKVNETRKANSIYSVLSNCEEVAIQIDERKEIGGNHLPIDYEDIGELVFDIHGLDKDYEFPRIKCSNEFKEYFRKENVRTVEVTMMMAMFYFFDAYLKWLIFVCVYDEHDKNQKGLVGSLAELCEVSKSRLVEIAELTKHSEEQSKEYLTLSHSLFKGLQLHSAVKYSKYLKKLIKDELQ